MHWIFNSENRGNIYVDINTMFNIAQKKLRKKSNFNVDKDVYTIQNAHIQQWKSIHFNIQYVVHKIHSKVKKVISKYWVNSYLSCRKIVDNYQSKSVFDKYKVRIQNSLQNSNALNASVRKREEKRHVPCFLPWTDLSLGSFVSRMHLVSKW